VAIADEPARGHLSGTADSSGYGPYHLFLLITIARTLRQVRPSCSRIDEPFISVKKTKVLCEDLVERNRVFISELRDRTHAIHSVDQAYES
jgi:hypothetical protein